MEEFENLKNKFKGSNKYMITLDYEEIKRIIEITENLISKVREKIEEYEGEKIELLQLEPSCARSMALDDCNEKINLYKELLQEGDK